MFCAHCEETIRKALAAEPGVPRAEVSWARERAVVAYAPERTDERAIRACVERAGYEVVSGDGAHVQIVSVLVLLLALSMLAFSLGTVPLMLGFGLISGRLNRKYSRVMLTVSALVNFVMGLNMVGNGLALSGVALPQESSNAAVTAMQGDGVQTLRTEIDFGSYPSVRVQAGVPVEWTIVVPEGKLNGCNGELRIPAFDLDVVLHEGDNPVTFFPESPGTFPYSCWMGMIHATIEVTP